MSTRSGIAIKHQDGSLESVYCHCDGYTSHNGVILHDFYKTAEAVQELIDGGDMSSLSDVDGGANYYDDDDGKMVFENYEALRKDFVESDREYQYVFDEITGKWSYADKGLLSYIRGGYGSILFDLEERVKKDSFVGPMPKWEPPKRKNGMQLMFSARGSMADDYDYDLPIGLRLIDETGYGCTSRSLATIIAGKRDNGHRITYETFVLENGSGEDYDKKTWRRGSADSIRPYSEKFGIGYYFDDLHGEPELIDKEDLDRIRAIADENERIERERLDAAQKEYERKMEIATMRWNQALAKHKGAKAVIVAEFMNNDSEIETDYFAESHGMSIPLAFSNHTRRLYSELRKAAAKCGIEEVKELAAENSEHEHDEDDRSLRKRYYGGWRIVKVELGHYGTDHAIFGMYDHPEYLLA